ncbi:recombinase family protein [uncultured Bradyrhizobium sp.]|uniref:recombinase family protein n=1 Tax=uncultured Bradyrhizobium sp. TaxID=199684 RepID=UPI0035C9DA6E
MGGKSPKQIAFQLNNESILSPRGGAWGQSTINGNRKRGTGILNNELYIGRQVWNRQQFTKDPDSGKRCARSRPDSEVVSVEVPELRILDQDLWDKAKAVQKKLEYKKGEFWTAQRPKGLFSYLIKCAKCGGGYSKISATHLGCSTARNKGTCDNRLNIRADELEERVLGALRGRLMNDALCKEFCQEYTAHLNRVRMEHNASIAGYQSEFEKNKREIDKLIDAITRGVDPLQVKDRINALSERQREIESRLARTEPAPVLIHPSMAHRYHVSVQNLIESLNEPEQRETSAALIRKLVEKIVLTPKPDDSGLTVDLYGDLAGILQASVGHLPSSEKIGTPREGDAKQQVKLVAGIGFEPMTFRL